MFGSFIFHGIFLLVIAPSSSSFLHRGYNVSNTDLKLERMITCLTSAGVDRNKIHVRGSGENYNDLNWQWNTLNGYLEPMAYLVATATSDIQKAVTCCRLMKVRVVARSGGHSYVKNGFGDSKSLVVDVAKMNKITLDAKRMECEIGPGARNGFISYTLWKEGFVLAVGICPSVGIAGFALGGGHGYFSRLLGLASDNLIEVEMVDAGGNLRVINNTTNKDLFWALRGGGGGNFGIVSKFKFKMYPAPSSIVYGLFRYSLNDFIPFYNAFQNVMTSDLPNNIFCLIQSERDYVDMWLYAFNGQYLKYVSVDSIERLYKSFGFPTATKSSIKLLSHSEFMLTEAQRYSNTLLTHPSQFVNMTKHNQVYWKKVKSIYVNKILNKDEIFKLKELLDTYLQYAGFDSNYFGGAVNNVSPSETAFVHRRSLFDIQMVPLSSQGIQPNATTDSAIKTFFEKSKTIFNHTESYQNYLDQDLSDFLIRYYGTNLKKLTRVKRLIDPENIFHHSHSIPFNFD